ncbi:MAG TPA: hypothetical protein VFS67_05975 [Polyangiaceae bacterium]|nr:hypothetical protein [Polyangiaceae bacterium]
MDGAALKAGTSASPDSELGESRKSARLACAHVAAGHSSRRFNPTGDAPSASATTALPARVKWAYATGGTVDVLGHWLYFNLADPVYT